METHIFDRVARNSPNCKVSNDKLNIDIVILERYQRTVVDRNR